MGYLFSFAIFFDLEELFFENFHISEKNDVLDIHNAYILKMCIMTLGPNSNFSFNCRIFLD
jgi:hypothetical protein